MFDKLLAMGFQKASFTTWEPLKKTEEPLHMVEIYHPKMGVLAKGKLALQFPVIGGVPTCTDAIILQVAELLKAEADKLPDKPTDADIGKAKAAIAKKMSPVLEAHIKRFQEKAQKAAASLHTSSVLTAAGCGLNQK